MRVHARRASDRPTPRVYSTSAGNSVRSSDRRLSVDGSADGVPTTQRSSPCPIPAGRIKESPAHGSRGLPRRRAWVTKGWPGGKVVPVWLAYAHLIRDASERMGTGSQPT